MGLRSALATSAMSWARGLGNTLGLRLAIVVSDHSVELKMVSTSDNRFAWDENMYRRANIFPKDYATPVKIVVNENPELADPDTVEGETATEDEDGPHVSLMSSTRYRLAVMHNIISQLINPDERLRYIEYALIGLAILSILSFFGIIVVMSAVGVF